MNYNFRNRLFAIKCVQYCRSCRENYGDEAVGYVCLRRDQSICTVKCRIAPEHNVRSTSYSVIMKIDEDKKSVLSVECLDCAASAGLIKTLLYFSILMVFLLGVQNEVMLQFFF